MKMPPPRKLPLPVTPVAASQPIIPVSTGGFTIPKRRLPLPAAKPVIPAAVVPPTLPFSLSDTENCALLEGNTAGGEPVAESTLADHPMAVNYSSLGRCFHGNKGKKQIPYRNFDTGLELTSYITLFTFHDGTAGAVAPRAIAKMEVIESSARRQMAAYKASIEFIEKWLATPKRKTVDQIA